MNVVVFSTRTYDRRYLEAANAASNAQHRFTFVDTPLTKQSAALAAGHDAVCAFVNDCFDEPTLHSLAGFGVRIVALRCAGFNNVDLATAQRLNIAIARVPGYSPA